jgi:hypothetical protein
LKEIGTLYGNGWPTGGDLSGDNLVLALGMYGVELMTV